MRVVLVLHRYLAVCIGVVMTLWCLSGFVMMYQEYPSFTVEERLRSLAPLDLSGCCNPDALPADDPAALRSVRIEMLGDAPVLRDGSSIAIDLRTGKWIAELSDEAILEIGQRYAQASAIATQPRSLGRVDIDQWTVQSARRNQPAHRLAFDDPAATEIYVNGATGEIFQDTNRRERVLTWLGAIPHWLYPTLLRQNGALWSQVVIWASVVGTFLAATGLYVGISRLQRRTRDGKLTSPFRGWWYWHHMLGLVFGVLTLTWVFSGLLTMSPWGLLEGGGGEYRQRLSGEASWRDIRRFLDDGRDRIGPGFTQLRFGSFNDELYVLASRADGTSVRFDASGARAELELDDIDEAVRKLGVPVRNVELLREEDSFYYGHKQSVRLPVYRIVLGDPQRTRLYVEPATGAIRVIDSDARWSRWIRRGLHGFDFTGMRVRPIWDVLVILMLVGVTAVCVTGTWMAFKRVRLDCRRLRTSLLRGPLSSSRQVSQQ